MIAKLKHPQPAYGLKRGQKIEVKERDYDPLFDCKMYQIIKVIEKNIEKVNKYKYIEMCQLLPEYNLKF